MATPRAVARPASAARGADTPQTSNPSSTTIGSPAATGDQMAEPSGS